jgi:hypothetical protein
MCAGDWFHYGNAYSKQTIAPSTQVQGVSFKCSSSCWNQCQGGLTSSSVADVGSWNRVGTRNPNRGNIDYRLMCYGNGHSSGHGNVFVTGLPGPATKWTPNDVFEVRVTDNTVSYLKNGLVFHTIAQVPGGGLPKGHCPTCATPTFPMHADFILASVGDGFTDVNMLSCK